MNTTQTTLPEPISKAISESGITDLTKAETIASHYAPIMGLVSEQMQLVKTLKKGSAEDVEKAKRIRIDLGKIASAAEKQKAADKQVLLMETRFIDALFNVVYGAARLTQSEAKDIEEHFERQEAERKAKLQNQREIEIQPFILENEIHPDYSAMSEDGWKAYMIGKKEIHRMRLESEAKAEKERIAKENAEAEAREAQRLENERLKKEAEMREKELAAEREKQAAIQREAEERIAAEKKNAEEIAAKVRAEEAAKLENERAERKRIEDELQRKKDAEEAARLRAEREEKDRIAAEKKAAKAPDKKKIEAAINSLQLPAIELKDVDSKAAYEVINAKFEGFKTWAKSQVQSL